MKIYGVYAYSSVNAQVYQCRAIRGDGVVFAISIERRPWADSGDVTEATVTCGDRNLLWRFAIPTSSLRLYQTSPEDTSPSDRHSWKAIAQCDVLDILKSVSHKVELSNELFAGESARRVFGFKKTGERSANP